MTLIELGVVMGIVTVLLALVLGLGRHVNEIVKIRRAQADLGEWHEVLNRWHLQFGEYPYEAVDVATGNRIGQPLLDTRKPTENLANILGDCHLRFSFDGSITNITLRSFLTSDLKLTDPWGSPYIYDCDPGRKAYTLYSCGQDSRSVMPDGTRIPTDAPATPDPTLDDIYFER